jgi:hypothetical protein
MRVTRLHAALIISALLAGAARTSAQSPPTRLIPADAELVVEVKQPRGLVEAITKLDVVKDLQQIPNVKEFLDSTQYRRFHQLVAYYERELSAGWPELLDKLAGGGAAVGMKFTPGMPPVVLLAIDGKDESALRKFVDLALKVIEQEINRQEGSGKLQTAKYQGIDVHSIGAEFHLALSGKSLLVSNNEKAIQAGLDLVTGKEAKSVASLPVYGDAARLLPDGQMATFWYSLKSVQERPELKELFKNPREPALTVLLGHYIDVVGRSPYVCASFGKEGDAFLTTIRVPAGREGMGPERTLHIPPGGQTGTRPLLEPKDVLYSNSFFLDFGKIWEDRVALFGEKNAKAIEEAEKNTGKLVFANFQLSKLLTQWGAYHRIVVAHQPKFAYSKTPKIKLPAFAFVTEMRDPDKFSKTLEAGLRGLALFGGSQIGLKLTDETYKDVKIAAYKFDEEKVIKDDVSDIRFNFTPCFARVGNQFVICSTLDLCRELIDLLKAEAAAPVPMTKTTSTDKFYSSGVAAILEAFERQLTTQAVLDQAVPADEAKEQVKAFISLVRGLGSLTQEVTFDDKSARVDVRIKLNR